MWMDWFAQQNRLAIMDRQHDMVTTKAKTHPLETDGSQWFHYAVTFEADGACNVYVDGACHASTMMEPPLLYGQYKVGNIDWGLSHNKLGKHYRHCYYPNSRQRKNKQ